MRPAKNLEKLIKKTKIDTNAKVDEVVLDDTIKAFEKSKNKKTASYQPNIWRIIMKSKITKLAIAAAIIFIVVLGINLLDKSATPAWAIEQTVEAFEEISTIIISGTSLYGSESLPFKCWIKLDDDNDNLFMRYESEREIVVVQGSMVYVQRPGSNKIKIIEGTAVHNLKFWYKVMDFSPWLTGKMLQRLKEVANDWHETYEKDEQTGRDHVFVTCSYKQLSSSFWFVLDLENKLIVRGKHWSNTDREGPPNMYANTFVYNEEIPDEIFEFEIPEGAVVVRDKEIKWRETLRQKAWELFENDQYGDAVKIYRQIESLMMVGICYDNMGQYDKAIEYFEKAIRESPDVQGKMCSTYFYLGYTYMQTGEKEKAIEAFKNCLRSGQGFREPEKFPLNNAQEYIEKLESQEQE